MEEKLEFLLLKGRELESYFDELAKLRITVFREFPYIYEGDYDYEKRYLQVYCDSDRSLVILVKFGGQVIGASTCIPLADEADEFKACFQENGLDIDQVCYFGESIILKEFRGNKIGHEFFRLRESHAQEVIPDLEWTTFCAVDRPIDHPLRPANYRPLDEFWMRQGYEKREPFKVFYPWKDLDQTEETTKPMTFWMKSWKK